GRALDDGAVGDRVREGHAELDDVGAARRRLQHEPLCGCERGVARREVGHQGALAAGAEIGEGRREARLRPGVLHLTSCPSAFATTWTSLSPRPESPTTIAFDRGSVFARRIAWATACADSSAGMMPSWRVSAWNPSPASSSVIETNSNRPASR